jgi:hypothetical protein
MKPFSAVAEEEYWRETLELSREKPRIIFEG